MPADKQAQTGTVKWFNETKGYGFILRDDNNQELFYHVSQILNESDDTQKDDHVSFVVDKDRSGRPIARCVKVI